MPVLFRLRADRLRLPKDGDRLYSVGHYFQKVPISAKNCKKTVRNHCFFKQACYNSPWYPGFGYQLCVIGGNEYGSRKASAESAAKKAAEAEAKKAPETEAPVAEAKKPAAKKPAAKKPAAKKPAAKKAVEVIVQSPLGGEISFAEILAKVGEADKVYVRVDQNKAYWVRGEETGDVDLW
jgi:hypothetical protein